MKKQILSLTVVGLMMAISFTGIISAAFDRGTSGSPNLEPWAVTLDPDPPRKGQSTNCEVTIKNTGTAGTGLNITTWTCLDGLPDPYGDGDLLDVHITYGLGKTEEGQWDFDFTWPSDTEEHNITVWVDVDDNVTESDENDNIKSYGPYIASSVGS